jgi:hypothetical protein
VPPYATIASCTHRGRFCPYRRSRCPPGTHPHPHPDHLHPVTHTQIYTPSPTPRSTPRHPDLHPHPVIHTHTRILCSLIVTHSHTPYPLLSTSLPTPVPAPHPHANSGFNLYLNLNLNLTFNPNRTPFRPGTATRRRKRLIGNAVWRSGGRRCQIVVRSLHGVYIYIYIYICERHNIRMSVHLLTT